MAAARAFGTFCPPLRRAWAAPAAPLLRQGPPTSRRAAASHARPGPVRHALVDIDGTLINAGAAIPGAAAALARLRAGAGSLRLVTNNSQEGSRRTRCKLAELGFAVEEHEVLGVLTVVLQLLREEGLRPLLLLEDSALEVFEDVPMHEPNAVVVGTAPQHLHYERLNEAARVLLESESNALVAVNTSRYFRAADGLSLGAGPFVAALSFATGRQARVVGKPSRDFFHASAAHAAGSATASPEACVMIGDDANDDVQGAMDAGMRAILVRTGKYRDGDEDRCRTPPLAVVDDIGGAVAFLEREGLLAKR